MDELLVTPGYVGAIGVRAALVVLAGCLLSLLLRRAASQTRRRLWAGVLLALLLLPAAGQILPPLGVRMLPAERAEPADQAPGYPGTPAESSLASSKTSDRPASAWAGPATASGVAAAANQAGVGDEALGRVLLVLWLVGLAVVLGRSIHGQVRGARLVARAREVENACWPTAAGLKVRCSPEIDLPMTVGLLRPVVLVPSGADLPEQRWPDPWRSMVLAHEGAHVRGLDPLLQLGAELACALHWWNPLVWLAARRLRIERELAADDAALLAGTRPSDYARCLLDLSQWSGHALPPPSAAVVSLLHPAGLKARLLGVLDGRRRRAAAPTGAAALALAGLLVFLPVATAVPMRLAESRPVAVAVRPVSANGPIVGQAIEAGTGRQLAGAEVDLYLRGYSPTHTIRVATDAQGYFRLPPYTPTPKRFVAYVRQGRLAARTPILAVPYGNEMPLRIELRPAPTLSGTVRSEDGKPLVRARVHFNGTETWAVSPGRDAMAETDERGRFELQGVLHGNYRLLVESPEGPSTVALARVDVSDVDGLDVTVPRRQPVTGRLLDESGAPIAGGRLIRRLRPPADRRRHFGWDETAADGSFSMLPIGQRIQARATAANGETLIASFSDGGEANLVEQGGDGSPRLAWVTARTEPQSVILRRAVYVSGTVRWPNGDPASGALVSGSTYGGGGGMETSVDVQGRYQLGPLEPGRVNVFARLPEHPHRADTPSAFAVRLLAAGSRDEDVHVVLRPQR